MPRTKKEWTDTAAQHRYYDTPGKKEESAAYQHEYYQNHKDEKREYMRKYNAKKREEKDRKVIETQGTEFAGRVADRVSFALEGTMMKFKQICIIREYVAKAVVEELCNICGIKEN